MPVALALLLLLDLLVLDALGVVGTALFVCIRLSALLQHPIESRVGKASTCVRAIWLELYRRWVVDVRSDDSFPAFRIRAVWNDLDGAAKMALRAAKARSWNADMVVLMFIDRLGGVLGAIHRIRGLERRIER